MGRDQTRQIVGYCSQRHMDLKRDIAVADKIAAVADGIAGVGIDAIELLAKMHLRIGDSFRLERIVADTRDDTAVAVPVAAFALVPTTL